MSRGLRTTAAAAYEAAMERRLDEIDRRTRRMPVRFQGSAAAQLVAILIGQGNELWNGDAVFDDIYGAKLVADASAPTAVPSAAPASLTPGATYAAGLCAGRRDNGDLVWVAPKVRIDGVTYSDLASVLVEGMMVLCSRTLTLPITGSSPAASAPVYLPLITGA